MPDVATTTRPGRVVLGLGGTVDYEVNWDASVVADLVNRYDIRCHELDTPGPIDTERDLVASMLAFMRAGAGGERYVASSAIIEQFATRLDTKVTLGGTCIRAAMAMSTIGVSSTVHLVSMNDATRELLPDDIAWVCSASEDTTDPHLIVQYPRGTRIRAGDIDLVTPHANRLIYANDPPHRELVLADELTDALTNAELFLVSSLNVIQDRDILDARLASLDAHMAKLDGDALVVFEDAGYHVPTFSAVVRDVMAQYVDVYGLNEDELQTHLGRRVDLLDPIAVTDAVTDFAAMVDVPALVVHTKHWSLAYGDQAHRYRHALASGTTMAATRFRCGDGFTREDFRATAPLPAQAHGIAVCRAVEERLGETTVCVPAHDVDVATPTTIGLGDTFVGGFVAALTSPSSTSLE